MRSVQQSLLTRDDTFLGVCEALGEDFGFNANILRVTLGVLLLWNPAVIVGGYVAAGIVVAFSRLIVPNPRRAAATAPAEVEPAAAPDEADETADSMPLAA